MGNMEVQFIMKPKVDFAFKEIMRNEMTRRGFLSAVLKIDPDDISKTEILNAYLSKQHEDEKLGILDVRILLNDNTEINIEIQVLKFDLWVERSLFYGAKMYTDQAEKGKGYGSLRKCICINILDYTLFPDYDGFYSQFHISEDTRHTIYTDKLEFHVIELSKLPVGLKENSDDLLLWAKFFNAEKEEEFEMLAEKNKYIANAYEDLQVISQDREKRMEYEARQKALRDYDQIMIQTKTYYEEAAKKMQEAEQRMQKAEQHMQEAEQRIQEAEQRIQKAEQRKREEIRDIAEKLIRSGAETSFITSITSLSASEVEEIRAKSVLP